MFKWLRKTLMHSEWKISLWYQIFGVGGILSSFGVSAWAASASAWLNAYGPIAWVCAGFLGTIVLLLSLLLYSAFRERLARAKLAEKRSETSTSINPLDDHFYKQVIHVSDIFSNYHQVLENKHFRECRFVGPMVISFGSNVNMTGSSMAECNFIAIDKGYIRGVVAFSNSTLLDCEFDSITFVVHTDLARAIRDDAVKNGGEIQILGVPI